MAKQTISGPLTVPLGVYSNEEKIYLFSKSIQGRRAVFQCSSSTDGTSFTDPEKITILGNKNVPLSAAPVLNVRIAKVNDQYLLTYKKKITGQTALCQAVSTDLHHWQLQGKLTRIGKTGMIVAADNRKSKHALYFGESSISVAQSQNLTNWEKYTELITPHQDFYGNWPLSLAAALPTDQGILLLYYVHYVTAKLTRFELKAALFDRQTPSLLVRKYREPVWETPVEWAGQHIHPVGVAQKDGHLLSYWWINAKDLIVVFHPLFKERIERKESTTSFSFKKLHHNPILEPLAHHYWESRATFNPAAFSTDNEVHLVYRAIGDHDVSVLGYATSTDGLTIAARHPEPIYTPTEEFEVSGTFPKKPHHSPFASGGGCYGGCEDPRITRLDNTLYMTYVAYNGWSPPRIALTSIQLADFLKHDWNWATPVLISAPNVVDKNACILPEKINGKYVIFHRVYPNILIDFVDSLDFDGKSFLQNTYQIKPRAGHWDSRKLGAGPPPIKTDDGWLLLYQAVDDRDDRKYKIGAMLLDSNDPTKVLHSTNKPVLEPTHWYENVGHKAGVAYPCGAVIRDDKLIMYYGGADTVVCAATANLGEFLHHLKTSETTQFEEMKPVFTN